MTITGDPWGDLYIIGAIVTAIIGVPVLAWKLAAEAAKPKWDRDLAAPLHKRIDGEFAVGGSVLVVCAAGVWPFVLAIAVIGGAGYGLVQGMEIVQKKQQRIGK